MDFNYFLIFGAAFAGLYMAWNIGANDVANSMATAVGAKAISIRQAIFIAALLNFLGAVLVGSHVVKTISKGIIAPSALGDARILALGFLATLISAGIWVTIATWKEMPISTTHAIVGAVLGFGLVYAGAGCVNWKVVGEVVLSWILSPIMGAIIGYMVFKSIVKSIFESASPDESAAFYAPFWVFLTVLIMALSAVLKTPILKKAGISTFYGVLIALGVSALSALIVGSLIKVHVGRAINEHPEYSYVEETFRKLQIATSCYVAFSHGANDVANAIGPMAAIVAYAQHGDLGGVITIPVYLLALGGFGIAIGIVTWGYKVIRTVAYKITKLTNTRGFSVDFGAATTILVASKLGMPVSTTHTVIGAVVGVGLARGIEGINLRVIRDIVISWFITLPVAAGTAAGLFMLMTKALL